jgi:hypothetical protein
LHGWLDLLKGAHRHSEGLLRTLKREESSKNQDNMTKIGCLVTQTLRQLTHMVLYFKHKENKFCLNSLVLLEVSSQRALLS